MALAETKRRRYPANTKAKTQILLLRDSCLENAVRTARGFWCEQRRNLGENFRNDHSRDERQAFAVRLDRLAVMRWLCSHNVAARIRIGEAIGMTVSVAWLQRH